jgi:hypothetical protein
MLEQPKRVSFEKCIRVQVIPPRTESTAEELSSISFSPTDLKEIRKRERCLSEELSVNGRLSNVDDDLTGLYSLDAKSQRKKRVFDGLLSVMMEQDLQWDYNGIQDHDYIAQVYSQTAHESRLLARHRGLETAMQVGKLSKREKSSITKSSSKMLKLPSPNLMRWITAITDSTLMSVSQAPLTPTRIRSSVSKMVAIPLDDVAPARCVEFKTSHLGQ